MTITAGLMIDEVLGLLQSWSLDEEQSTTLNTNINASALTFDITTARGIATGVSPGIVEIGSELIYVDSVSGTTCTVVPWGRGYKNTTAASHSVGDRVVSQPTFPRSKTLDAMNQVLNRIFPMIYAVKQYESTTTYPVITYDVPDDLEWVLDAKWMLPDGRQYWQDIRRWRVNPGGGTHFGDGLNGVTVDVADGMQPGQPIQFIYASKPGLFTAETDVFSTVTGLTDSVRDVITLGAASYLTMSQELSRLQVATIEQQNRSQVVAPSAALTSSRFLDQRFQQRLMEERRALQRLYPPRVTGTWK